MPDSVMMQDRAETAETAADASNECASAVCPCGAGLHTTTAGMCAAGHFIVGNQARRTHGAYSFRDRGTVALPDVLRQTVEEFREAVIADRGGPSELSTLEAAYIRRLSEVETVARLLAADLASRGLTTPRGRVRGTFSRWLECLDRWDRLAQRVGTDRRSRALTLHDYLTRAPHSLEPRHEDAEASLPTTEVNR
jgi:hypothetical protein